MRCLLILGMALTWSCLPAQQDNSEVPFGILNGISARQVMVNAVFKNSPIIVPNIQHEGEEYIPPREENAAGEMFNTEIHPENQIEWTQLENGLYVWRTQINADIGNKIFVHFSRFDLPENAFVYIYAPDQKSNWRRYGAENNNAKKRLSSTIITGKSVIVEVNSWIKPLTAAQLTIDKIGCFYENAKFNLDKEFGDSEACNPNVLCPAYVNWCDERRSVAMIVRITPTNQIRWATGSLIVNERFDGRPYFLTAEHTLDENNDLVIQTVELDAAEDWLFIFNYQSPTCANPSLEPTTGFDISGCQVIDHNFETDYALLELNQRPPRDFNAYYNAWSNRNQDMTTEGTCIHHPDGDIKKISEWERITSLSSKFWKVKHVVGTTAGGSSGSPLYNINGFLVGQLSRGSSLCSNDEPDIYGRFDKSWHDYGLDVILNPNGDHTAPGINYITTAGGSETCRISWNFASGNDLHTSSNVTFLNPASLGTRMYDGVYNATTIIEADAVQIQNGTSVRFEAGQQVALRPGFSAVPGSNFSAEILMCERGCGNGFKTISDSYTPIFTLNAPEDNLEEQMTQEDDVFSIFPNPNTGLFTVTSKTGIFSQQEIELIDLHGKVIKQIPIPGETNKIEVNMSEFERGVYFIHLKNEENGLKKIIYF